MVDDIIILGMKRSSQWVVKWYSSLPITEHGESVFAHNRSADV